VRRSHVNLWLSCAQHMSEAISLYRAIWRAAGRLPTTNRVAFIRAKLRYDYEQNRAEAGEELQQALQLGYTHLDNVLSMGTHLTEVWNDPRNHASLESVVDTPHIPGGPSACSKMMGKLKDFGPLPNRET